MNIGGAVAKRPDISLLGIIIICNFYFFSRRIMFIAFDHAFFTTHAREKFNFDEKKSKNTHILR